MSDLTSGTVNAIAVMAAPIELVLAMVMVRFFAVSAVVLIGQAFSSRMRRSE
jgi:hypothetical protein